MCQEFKELLLIESLRKSILILSSKSDTLIPRFNLLTFNQREFLQKWVSMFSRSHFSHFVSYFSKDPNPMSKRGQEQNSGEGSAMAKSKPMSLVQTKTWPRNLESQVSYSSCRWSEWSSSSTLLSNPENLEKALTQISDFDRSSGKPFEHDCDLSDNVEHSQVRKQENRQSTEIWKQAKIILPDGSFWKRSSNAVNTIDTEKEFRTMRITDSEKFRRSSDSYNKSWEFKRHMNPSVSQHRKPTSLCGDCSCLRRWGQQTFLDRITRGICRITGPWILNRVRSCSPLHKMWWRTIL